MKNLTLLASLLIISVFFTNAQSSFSNSFASNSSFNSTENYIQASVYPNPSNGYFSLKLKDQAPYNVAIYAMNGTLVYQQENIDNDHILIDITNLVSRGFYHVRITQNENAIIKKLIVK